MTELVIGIDVQDTRGCAIAVLDTHTSHIIETGWIAGNELAEKVQQLALRHQGAVFAIDAPRMPLPAPRTWYWRNNRGWHRGAGKEKGKGRHCEVVIKACNLANPQWTPLAQDAPIWMQHGFKIFESLQGRARALEVFPSASYRMLNESSGVEVSIPLKGFLPGPKDMLDAVVAAVTGMEFLAGRGQEVGGGDGLGTIVLPRRIASDITEVLRWPSSEQVH